MGYFPRYYGEPPPISNAIKWNGISYEYSKIKIKSSSSDTSYIDPLQTAIAFSENDIWVFTHTGGYSRFDGSNWSTSRMPLESRKGSITKVWGFSSDDLYLIGRNGSITHYDGENFTLMESGTDADLFDIHGYINPVTGEKTVWITCAGWPKGQPDLLKLSNDSWNQEWYINKPGIDNFQIPHNIQVLD